MISKRSHAIRRCLCLLPWFGMLAGALPAFAQGGRLNRPIPMTQPQRITEPPMMRMRLEGQELTAEIRVTPLQQVLAELAARTGIIFQIESQENPLVSISFFRVGLPEAVQRLTANANSMSYYSRDESGQNRLTLVRIISRNPKSGAPSLQYIGTGAITKRGTDVIDSPDAALTVLAESTDVMARQKAIEVLVASNGPATIPALKLALSDPEPEVRVAAIEAFAGLGTREVLPQILTALRDSHPGVRQSAIMAVSQLGDTANIKNLRPLLRDPDPSVAASAEMAIRKLSGRLP